MSSILEKLLWKHPAVKSEKKGSQFPLTWKDFFLKCDKIKTFCPELLQRFPVSRFPGKGFLTFAQNSLVLFWKLKKKKKRRRGYFLNERKGDFIIDSYSTWHAADFNLGARRKMGAAGGQPAQSMAFLATIPASFLALPLSCPKVSAVWQRQRHQFPPRGPGPLGLVAPQPRGPWGPYYHFLPQRGSPLHPALPWAPLFRVKKKFRAIEWW